MTDSKLAALLLLNIAAAWGCTTIHVPTKDGGPMVIARTMELAGLVVTPKLGPKGGLQLGHLPWLHPDSDKDPILPWTVSMHREGEEVGNEISSLCNHCDGWTTDFGYVSVDVASSVTDLLQLSKATDLATDGINEKGLTVSAQTFRQSAYMEASPASVNATNVCFTAFAAWVLGKHATVASLIEAIPSLNIVKTIAVDNGLHLHWTIDDASGAHVVLEVIDGSIVMHDNTVGTLTNDPDFTWQLRNLNNFVSLRSTYPKQEKGIGVDSPAGFPADTIPFAVGVGQNLLGLPGDYSPPSRFVRAFYLKEYAMLNNPPKTLNDSITLATGLLNTVYINKGTVAAPPKELGDFTQYTVLKIPANSKGEPEFYYKDYVNTKWRKVNLGDLDFTPKQGATPITYLLDDGRLAAPAIEDVTARFKNAPDVKNEL